MRLTLWNDLTVGDGIQVLDPAFFPAYSGSVEVFQVLTVERDAHLADQGAALVADVVDHSLGDQDLGEFRQAPGESAGPALPFD